MPKSTTKTTREVKPETLASDYAAQLPPEYQDFGRKCFLDGFLAGQRRRGERNERRKEQADAAMHEALQQIPEHYRQILTVWVAHCRSIDSRLFLTAASIVHDYEELHAYCAEDTEAAMTILNKSIEKNYKSWCIPFAAKNVRPKKPEAAKKEDAEAKEQQLAFDERPARPVLSEHARKFWEAAQARLFEIVQEHQGELAARQARDTYWRFLDLWDYANEDNVHNFTIAAPSRWVAQHVREEWGREIADALCDVTKGHIIFNFLIPPTA